MTADPAQITCSKRAPGVRVPISDTSAAIKPAYDHVIMYAWT
jgi:hypothetical protein